MKKCPFCAEEILDEAIKCKHCGSMLQEKPHGPWYFKTSVLVIALLSVGPFALPLMWLNPRLSNRLKIIVSIIVLILSYYLWAVSVKAVNSIREYYRMLGV